MLRGFSFQDTVFTKKMYFHTINEKDFTWSFEIFFRLNALYLFSIHESELYSINVQGSFSFDKVWTQRAKLFMPYSSVFLSYKLIQWIFYIVFLFFTLESVIFCYKCRTYIERRFENAPINLQQIFGDILNRDTVSFIVETSPFCLPYIKVATWFNTIFSNLELN